MTMIRAFELIDMVRAYNAGADEALLDRAYVFAMKAHGAQTRANGEPYFNHPIEVAAILTELRLDDATIVTALLHDTIEDTDVTAEEISERFSPEIAQLVDGVTKLSKLALVSRERAQAENFRKLLMAMAKDPRVLLVKMADRLHNMRTINHLPEHKRARIAQETLEIFAPLAGRMGMQRIRDELEDLAFAVLSPEARVSVMRRFVHLKQTQDLGVMSEIEDMLREMLVAAGLAVAKVYGREKRPYAIWRKSQEKGVAFEQLSDIMGFRVVLETEAECYQALGVIHSAFTAVPYRFKDYISAPKVNGYRSLHTAVIGPDGARIEVQIRTLQMHEVAETGVAAHWSYKEGVRQSNPFAVDPFRWLRDLVERVESGAPAEDDPEDILEDAKRELSFDQVFCFTPRGKVISLPRGATALDFAYAIHTDVGHSAVGVKINGKRVALGATLRNGQTVEILQSEGQEPSPIWRQFVKTGRARAAIRRTLRAIEKRQAAERGEHLLRLAYDRAGARWSDKALETAAQRLGAADRATMLADIGEARLTPSKALAAVYPELAAAAEAEMTAEAGAPGSPGAGDSARQQAPISELAPARAVVDPKRPQVVLSKRRGGAPTADGDLAAGAELAETNGRMTLPAAPCCRPIPGERIVALAEPEVGYRLHAIDCAALAAHEDDMDRWLDVVWAPEASAEAEHGASVEVFLANEPGALGEICTMIGRSGANIDGVEVLERGTDFHRIRFDMDVRDIRHLSNILTALSAQPIVADAVRLGRADEREIDPEMGLRPTLDADPMAEEPAIEPADPVEAQAAEEASAQRGDGGEAAGQGRRANENRTPPGVEAQQTHNHGAA